MTSSTKTASKRRTVSAFQVAARGRGLSAKQAKMLEPAAVSLFGETPQEVLESRESFQQVVSETIRRDLAELELSFAAAEECAAALELLDLGRCSEVPDPYRRVWVDSADGHHLQGVVLPGREGEVAVFCPLKGEMPEGISAELELRYRECETDIRFELQVLDSVRLPNARVLHLGRRRDAGTGHGRVTHRHEIEVVGFVRRIDADHGPETPLPCRVVDISLGGTRLLCAARIEEGIHLQLDIFLDDGMAAPLSVTCQVRWVEVVPEGNQIGLHFENLPETQSKRLEQAIRQFS